MAAGIFGKAFLEALGKRTGEGVADPVSQRIRIFKKAMATEAEIGMNDGHAVRFVVADDLPDEARLALLDLDGTDPRLNGKELYWDSATGRWHAIEALPAKPDEAADGD